MDGRCDKHQFEPMERICRSCGGEFCQDCLVYSHGHGKPPFCVSCALAAAGVRSSAQRAVVKPKREIRKALRADRKAVKAAAKGRTYDDGLDLADAAPVRLVEYEFTINDDGSVDHGAESRTS
ncbi:MAG: B-box zinc finger protein [Acidimicrobiia bacterium]|nr:B-box zinc finger protein [Acidimicrobiia bacterium]